MNNRQFSYRCIEENTWQITGSACDCYLLLGNDDTIMIDAGAAQEDIREFAQTLIGRPVEKVINTHSHFDHTGGNRFFSQIFATEGIAKSAKNTMNEYDGSDMLEYDFTYLQDGDMVALRGRPLKILVLDCHSRENLAVLDKGHRILFVGDEIDAGQVLLLPGYAEKRGQLHSKPAASVETYQRVLEKLLAQRDQFDWLCTGHNGSPLPVCYLEWYWELCERILSGKEQGQTDCSGKTFPKSAAHYPYPEACYRRAGWKGASLVYCANRIWDKDPPGPAPATPLHALSAYTIRQ